MPRKDGRLTGPERVVAKALAETGNQAFAAQQADIGRTGVLKAASRPAVQAEIVRIQQELLFSELLPLAVQVHKELLLSDRTPAGAKVQAVKLAYDRTIGADGAGQAKEPHEMTPEEIAKAIAELERVAFARAKPVAIEAKPAESDVFD